MKGVANATDQFDSESVEHGCGLLFRRVFQGLFPREDQFGHRLFSSCGGSDHSLAGVCGRRISVRPQQRSDWTVVPNLWGAVIGRRGLMKSPAISEALRPLSRLELNAKAVFDDQDRQHKADLIVLEARKNHLKGHWRDQSARIRRKPKPSRNRLSLINRKPLSGNAIPVCALPDIRNRCKTRQ